VKSEIIRYFCFGAMASMLGTSCISTHRNDYGSGGIYEGISSALLIHGFWFGSHVWFDYASLSAGKLNEVA
jgi:pimeloyl-ACP methyl ester carboxylesterase